MPSSSWQPLPAGIIFALYKPNYKHRISWCYSNVCLRVPKRRYFLSSFKRLDKATWDSHATFYGGSHYWIKENTVGEYIYTVEVGSLHTLRLESIKLIFQPLHKFLVNKLSFGKSVGTSTLCMTQVIFPTIVYRQIIWLIIHCITIPVGQRFTYTKLTVPLDIWKETCYVS